MLSYHSDRLTATATAATIASLQNVGFGRVVLVGNNTRDKQNCEEAFRVLWTLEGRGDLEPGEVPPSVGDLELSFQFGIETQTEFNGVLFSYT